jgi:diguanylate cyclase (GGDEF)-like protein
VSIGVAAYPKDGHDANELIHQADLAVYQAKLLGRNRVVRRPPDELREEPAAELLVAS